MVVCGKEAWLRGGEVFSVFFRLLARFAPTEARVKSGGPCRDCASGCSPGGWGCVDCYECFARAASEDRELALSPWAAGVGRRLGAPGAGGARRGVLRGAGARGALLRRPPGDHVLGVAAKRDLAAPGPWALRAAAALSRRVPLFVKLSQTLGGETGRLGRFAAAYVFSLVPIAVAYHVAHYLTLSRVQGQAIFRHVSDPFGWGWDLFGTSAFTINAGVIGARLVSYSRVELIVAGHVIAVYLAHAVALRLFEDHRRALLSQRRRCWR